MDIIGVDFSGAQQEGKTWICTGVCNGRTLVLKDCKPIARTDLEQKLAQISKPTIAAMDFPFSVPRAFAAELSPRSTTMPQLWKAVAGMDYGPFEKLGIDFVKRHGLKRPSPAYRKGDAHYSAALSPLKKNGPTLINMTFFGMQMLHQLKRFGFHVPPLAPVCDDSPTAQSTLLEVMPGVVLKALGLPDSYKSSKNPMTILENRRKIVKGLKVVPQLHVCGLDRFRDECLVFDDCLDAVVAAVAAALWKTKPSRFLKPAPTDDTARLEGWIYAPRPI